MKQIFIESKNQDFENLDIFPGASWSVLDVPVPDGSIHRLKMKEGTRIPPHTHPADEFVYILSGTLKTGGRVCEKGTFWKTPAGVRQGPHEAITDCEIITMRLGAMGEFEGL
jgi:quercetin dioxygenase-like cupin family protein